MVQKRIVIVTHYYPPHSGGIEIVAENQARRLALLGHQVTVVTSKVSQTEHSGLINGVNVVRVKAWNGLEKKSIPFPIFSPSIAFVLFREIKRADIVHIHDAFYIGSFWAAVNGRLLKRPILLTQHVSIVPHQSKITELIQKVVYSTSGKVVFKSSNLITTLNARVTFFVQSCGIPASKLVWLANGVDGSLFYPAKGNEARLLRKKYNLASDKTIVLFVGRFVHKKGFDKVVEAANSKYQLVCVGGKTTRKSTQTIRFLGQVSQAELAEIYRTSDIFVLPSEGEGFPLSVQEAMACGLAIVMRDDEGYSPYKLDKKRVKLLTNAIPQTIEDALCLITDDTKKRREMGSYSLQYAREHFLWEKIINQLEGIYDRLSVAKG